MNQGRDTRGAGVSPLSWRDKRSGVLPDQKLASSTLTLMLVLPARESPSLKASA
jgi:hypothetical protein